MPANVTRVKALLGSRIRALRKSKGWSQEVLADRARVHVTYLSGIERGERNPSLKNLFAIARALNLTLSALFDLRSEALRDVPSQAPAKRQGRRVTKSAGSGRGQKKGR